MTHLSETIVHSYVPREFNIGGSGIDDVSNNQRIYGVARIVGCCKSELFEGNFVENN